MNKSLQESRVYLLSHGDEDFERDKAQVLCLKPDLNVSQMNFFKTMVDGQLVYMEKASPEAEVSKDVTTDDLIPVVQEDEQHDV